MLPTAHYWIGGLRVDEAGHTRVPGLYAAGQVVGGVHGANRLGSTSLPGAVAMGLRAGAAAAAEGRAGGEPPQDAAGPWLDLLGRGGREHAVPLTRALQRQAWRALGPARTLAGLRRFQGTLRGLADAAQDVAISAEPTWNTGLLALLELRSLLVVAERTAAAALARPETLGAHVVVDRDDPVPEVVAASPGAFSFAIQRSHGRGTARVTVDLHPGEPRPVVLDALLAVQERQLPELALRWGCRNQRCGTCTVSVDGRPRLACRDRLRPGSVVGPLAGLPVARDLVVERPAPPVAPPVGLPAGQTRASPSEAWVSLDRCITCFACVDGCPAHGAGAGSPVAFLRLQQIRVDGEATPADGTSAVAGAVSLGLVDHCGPCRGCRCGIGIRLVPEVIDPLLAAAEGG